ncbi:toxin-activating lysine-acyltransferase [Leptothrix discophora]|uniref:RTX toxin-activating lysine-acyltransferase n=1 Tax=Leptothrix discophora TaxID=89 RepID=A0ABT9FYH1_LEPDI|nr:toxin-activating lysine-acyltransferase [Leptothrix discophora]MDP4299287.1 toxin-activating lysine-acyltransferase [Leptothrix discophora]
MSGAAAPALVDVGVVSWLAMIGDTHHRLTAQEFLRQLEPLLLARAVHVIQRGAEPVAWLAWRSLSEPDWRDRLVQAGSSRSLAEVRGNVWLDFWVRPFGCDDRVATAVRELLRKRGVQADGLSWHDPSADGGAGRFHFNVPLTSLAGL